MVNLLSDRTVIELRNKLRSEGHLDARHYAKMYGVNKEQVNKAINGRTYKHLDEISPPTKQTTKKADAEKEANRLYLEGKSYNEISKLLGVSKSTLSRWLAAIVRPRPPKKEKVKAPPKVKEPKVIVPSVPKVRKKRATKAREMVTCFEVTCGKLFVPPKKSSKYCSVTCRCTCMGRSANERKSAKKALRPAKPPRPSSRMALPPFQDYRISIEFAKGGNRPRAILSNPTTGERKYIMYSRYLMSTHLGRLLQENEIVRYKDGTYDAIENLELVTREQIEEEHASKRKKCLNCDNLFYPQSRDQKYCSQSCNIEHKKKEARKKLKIFMCVCEICEEEFESKLPDRDLCSKTECREIVAKADRHERRVVRVKS